MYTINYTYSNGSQRTFDCSAMFSDCTEGEIYHKARLMIANDLTSFTASNDPYITSATLMENYAPYYTAERESVYGKLTETYNYAALISEMLDMYEFSLYPAVSKETGEPCYKVDDLQGVFSPPTEDEFLSPSDVLDRFGGAYLDDHVFNDLDEETEAYELSAENVTNAKEYVEFMNKHHEFKFDHLFEYDILNMYSKDPAEIDQSATLKDIYAYANRPSYTVSGYYSSDMRGLAEDTTSRDFSYAAMKAHEMLMKGLNVRIQENSSGIAHNLLADEYIKDFNGEFPLSADAFSSECSAENVIEADAEPDI